MNGYSAVWDRLKGYWCDPQGRILLCTAMLLAVSLPLNYLMLRLTGWSVLWPMRTWLTGGAASSGDSWHVMQIALDWIRSHPDGGLYNAIFFEGQNKFQYAPTSLLPMVGLEALGVSPTSAFLNQLNFLFIAITAAAVGALTYLLLGRAGYAQNRLTGLAAALLTGVAVLVFYPVMMGYHLGQLQVWINMLFALACVAWVTERRALAGVLIGLICLLKPQFGLFVLWALLRKEWRFLFALCFVGALGLLTSVVLFGYKNHFEYLSVLQFLSRHGESYWANQSLNGLLHRLVGNGISEWTAGEFPPYNVLVYAGTMLATVTILVLALSARRGESIMASLMDFMLAALAFTVASPIAWEHHYGLMAPMFAALFAASLVMAPGRNRRSWLIALVVCYVFAANCFSFTREWSSAPFNIVQSYLFFSALGVIGMLRLVVTGAEPRRASTD